MHIVDGALTHEVVIGGAVLAVGGLVMGLRKLTIERIPATGVLSATFFIASLIHVPVGPASVHLMMSGLAGLVLGWAAFPALFVGLLLQVVFFGFGGLTVLGVNTFNIAMPAVLAGLAFRGILAHSTPVTAAIWGGCAGAASIILTTLFVAATLMLSGDAFVPAAKLVLFAHIPIMIVEGLVSAAAVYLIFRVKPGLIMSPTALAAQHARQSQNSPCVPQSVGEVNNG